MRCRRSTDTAGRALVAVPKHEHLLMLVRRLGYSSSLLQVAAASEDDDFFVALAPTALALGTTVTTPAEFRNSMDSEHRCATVLIWRQEP